MKFRSGGSEGQSVNVASPAAAPTMIIPKGTEVQVDVHGQLSIRTPGNLVIQNSGSYGVLESQSGSIRIESNAQIEAVTVRCADTCFVQGSLTAWKVEAKCIQLDSSARANIVLQETEELAIGKEARLVGNFASEKELFLLFSRFSDQFRSIPFFPNRRPEEQEAQNGEAAGAVNVREMRDVSDSAGAEDGPGKLIEGGIAAASERGESSLPDPLFFALVLLERESGRSSLGPTAERVVGEIVKLLHARDEETLKLTHRTLFARISDPGRDVKRAAELVQQYFDSSDAS